MAEGYTIDRKHIAEVLEETRMPPGCQLRTALALGGITGTLPASVIEAAAKRAGVPRWHINSIRPAIRLTNRFLRFMEREQLEKGFV